MFIGQEEEKMKTFTFIVMTLLSGAIAGALLRGN
jgi:membrane associated rhomboid family serine protease